MKKITESEALAIITKPVGRVSHLRSMLLNLKPGEYLLVDKKDFTWKRKTPSVMCRRLEADNSTLKFDCKRALDGSGWLVKRIR